MTARRPLVFLANRITQLPQGDTLAQHRALVFVNNRITRLPPGDTLIGAEGGNIPPGAAVMTDAVAMYAQIDFDDTALIANDEKAFFIDAAYDDSINVKNETLALDFKHSDALAMPGEVIKFDFTHQDDNAGQSETVNFGIGGYAETQNTPGEIFKLDFIHNDSQEEQEENAELDFIHDDENAGQTESLALDLTGYFENQQIPDIAFKLDFRHADSQNGESEAIEIDFIHGDSLAGKTETLALDLKTFSDSIAGKTETLKTGFSGYQDSSNSQSESKSTNLSRWATTNSTSGTVTNKDNALGQNNGTVAQCKATGLIPVTPSTLNLNIVQPLTGAGTSPTFTAWYKNTSGLADTFTNQVSYRKTGDSSNTVLTLPTGDYSSMPYSVELTNINTSVNVVATFTHNAAVALTGGNTQIDAVCIQSTGVL